MTLTLLHDAMILTLDPAKPQIEHGYVLVRDTRIEAVAAGEYRGAEAPDQRIDCSNKLIAPGPDQFAHPFPVEHDGGLRRPPEPSFVHVADPGAHPRRTPDEIRLSVLLTAYGLLSCGTNGRNRPFPGPALHARRHERRAVAPGAETGMRIALGMRFFDGPFSDIFPSVPLPDDLKSRMSSVGDPRSRSRRRSCPG